MSDSPTDAAVDAFELGTWSYSLTSGEMAWDARFRAHLGIAMAELPDYETFLAHVHVADRGALHEAMQHQERIETTFRASVGPSERERWIEMRGSRRASDVFTGAVADVTTRVERAIGSALGAELSAAFAHSVDPTASLELACAAIVRHLDCAFARVWTLEREDRLILRASSGSYSHVDGEHAEIRVGQLKIGRIAREGRPHLSNDVATDPEISDPEWAKREGMVAFAGHPLITTGRLVGVVALFARRPLSASVLVVLAAVADQLAVAIDRARALRLLEASDARSADLLAEAEANAESLETLNSVGKRIGAELDVESIVQTVTDAATRLSGAQFGAFFYNVRNAQGESYTLYAISGVSRAAFDRFPMPRKTAIFANTFEGVGIVRLADVRTDPLFGKNAPYMGMPAGHLPVVSYLAVPVISRDGEVLGGLFFGHGRAGVFDERAERQVSGLAAQAAIAMDNARLFREAKRLIRELEKSNADLDQVAYVASHDLKAPLRGIASLSQWVEEDLGDRITDKAREHLVLLRRRVQRLEALIDGILSYSRAGRAKDVPEPIESGTLVRDTWELLSPPTSASLQMSGDMPLLVTERVPLQQVLMNLLGNAIKHADRADPHVQVKAQPEGEHVHFFVGDDGRGISPRFHERIWGVFQTLEARDRNESTGIGLAVVRKIVESKGGRTWVESDEGRGAIFHFTWPRDETGA